MGKKRESTIENRVYLFRDLAAAWLADNGAMLADDRERGLRALADLAYVSCVVSDTEDREAADVRDAITSGSG